MHVEFKDFFNNKQDVLKNLSASVVQLPPQTTTSLINHNTTDRLITSISMIKEVLQSNMALREDLLRLT
jgi:hypothetical protein